MEDFGSRVLFENDATLAEIETLLPDAQQQRQNKKRIARMLD